MELFAGFIGLVIGCSIGAVLLRAAVSLFNKRSAHQIAEPKTENAFFILFIAAVVLALAYFGIPQLFSGPGANERGHDLAIWCAPLLSIISLVLMLRVALSTSFLQTLIVTGLYALIASVITVPLIALGYFIMHVVG